MIQKFISNPGADELPRTADVVIIGGGPAGTAALWAIDRLAPGTHSGPDRAKRPARRRQFARVAGKLPHLLARLVPGEADAAQHRSLP